MIEIKDDSLLCARGKIDLKVRHEILHAFKSKIKKVEIPNVEGSYKFWSWFEKKVSKIRKGHHKIELKLGASSPPYKFKKSAAISFSGGAESTLIRSMFPYVDCFIVDRNKFTTNPFDGMVPIIGAGLGYWTTFGGDELQQEEDYTEEDTYEPYYFELSDSFRRKWLRYSGGAHMLSPLAAMRKGEVIQRLAQAKLPFVSCGKNNSKSWCRQCWKCAEAFYLSMKMGVKPPMEHRMHLER